MATIFRHKSTGEHFTAETFSVDEYGKVWLQRLRVDGKYLLGGDAEIDVSHAADPVNDEAIAMLRGAKQMAEDDKATGSEGT